MRPAPRDADAEEPIVIPARDVAAIPHVQLEIVADGQREPGIQRVTRVRTRHIVAERVPLEKAAKVFGEIRAQRDARAGLRVSTRLVTLGRQNCVRTKADLLAE